MWSIAVVDKTDGLYSAWFSFLGESENLSFLIQRLFSVFLTEKLILKKPILFRIKWFRRIHFQPFEFLQKINVYKRQIWLTQWSIFIRNAILHRFSKNSHQQVMPIKFVVEKGFYPKLNSLSESFCPYLKVK